MSYEDAKFVLPNSLVTRHDLRRLIVELEHVDNDLLSANVRERVGHEGGVQLHMSDMLAACVEQNNINMYEQSARSYLLDQLRRLKDHAPVVHMTFASNVKQDTLSKLASWLREKVDPQAVIDVGLQPGLIGGVHVRTTNKVFDMSLRSQLADGRKIIVKELESMHGVK